MFLSSPAHMIVSSAQWGGLLIAASEFPLLIGVAGAIKSFAVALLAYQRTRRDVLKAGGVGHGHPPAFIHSCTALAHRLA